MKRNIFFVAIAMTVFSAQTKAQTVKQTNITPITGALSTVVQLQPITFSFEKDWVQKLKLQPKQSGFDMATLQNTNPQLIVNQHLNYTAGKNHTQTAVVPQINVEALIPLLVSSIKEQQTQIEALKAEINLLKSRGAK